MKNGADHPKKIVVVGGGRAGEAILDLLKKDERYSPHVCDIDYGRLRALRDAGLQGEQISGVDLRQMKSVLQDAALVVCAAPPWVASSVARAAADAGCHFVDMSEDPTEIEKVASVRTDRDQCFISGCGLAPGLVSALVDSMIRGASDRADITAYVGALPWTRINRLGYGNLWGIDGLMAEYTNPSLALMDGAVVSVPPLGALERISIGQEEFEAFTTAGSLEGLVNGGRGKVRGLAFKTLRYPGHLDFVKFLLDDLKLSDRLYMFRNLLLNGLPKVERDRVVIHIVDRCRAHPRQRTLSFDAVPLNGGGYRTAIASVSALHVCAVVEVVCEGLAPGAGMLREDSISLELLGQSRYGRALQLAN